MRYTRPAPTRAEKIARVAQLVCGMTDERVMTCTAEDLARMTGAPLHECAERLARAKERIEG